MQNIDKNFHDHIDNRIVARLTHYGTVYVSPLHYQDLLKKFNPYIQYLSKRARIPTFAMEDLESFFHLKLYQMLSYGKYNPGKGQSGLFMLSFRNLMNDISRMSDRLIKRGVLPMNEEDILPLYLSAEPTEFAHSEEYKELLRACTEAIEGGDDSLRPLGLLLLKELGYSGVLKGYNAQDQHGRPDHKPIHANEEREQGGVRVG